MTLIFISAALIMLSAALAAIYPLVTDPVQPFLEEDAPREADFVERESLLEALTELEQEHLANKISKEDYAEQKTRLQQRYIEVVEAEESA